MSFTCAFCGRTLTDNQRDEDLHGDPCCLVCGPVEDESRARHRRPPTGAMRAAVGRGRPYSLQSIREHTDRWLVTGWSGRCGICGGEDRNNCACANPISRPPVKGP